MSSSLDKLPTNPSKSRQAAKSNFIGHVQSLDAGTPLASGSKFKFEHFLRIRVLYLEEVLPAKIAESQLFSKEESVIMEGLLEKDTDAAFLKTFLKDSENIKRDWNAQKAKQCGKFAVALEHLQLQDPRFLDATLVSSFSRASYAPRLYIETTLSKKAVKRLFRDLQDFARI